MTVQRKLAALAVPSQLLVPVASREASGKSCFRVLCKVKQDAVNFLGNSLAGRNGTEPNG